MIDRRKFLQTSAALALAGPAMAAPAVNSVGLRATAQAKGFMYGAAAANYQRDVPAFTPALAREAGILVAEYESKRDEIEPAEGQFDFSGTDLLLSYAQSHDMAFRFHPLVWYAANPDWLEPAVLATKKEALYLSYVDRVMRRYHGKLHSVDVVNEALLPGDGRSDGLRNSFWLKAFGPSYIDNAFHAARQADPSALLIYNDWGFEAGDAENDLFRATTLKFLDGLLKRGVPVDGLGLQGHLDAFQHKIDQKKLAIFLDEVKARGLKILVTEMDVYDNNGPADIATRDTAVADTSRRFLDVVLANSATSAVLTWGLSDHFLKAEGLRENILRGTPRRLPLDSNFQRKPMWDALAKSFSARSV